MFIWKRGGMHLFDAEAEVIPISKKKLIWKRAELP
jgi:hypothetical protein